MKIVWAPQAIGDLLQLRAWLEEEAPEVDARVIVTGIIERVESLLERHAAIGRAGRLPDTAIRE